MAYQKVNGKRIYFDLRTKKAGDVLFEDGVFADIVKRPETAKFPGNDYHFRLPNRDIAVINGTGTTKAIFEGTTGVKAVVKIGDKVRVTYLGKEALTSGKYKGTMTHMFDVEIDTPEGVEKYNVSDDVPADDDILAAATEATPGLSI